METDIDKCEFGFGFELGMIIRSRRQYQVGTIQSEEVKA